MRELIRLDWLFQPFEKIAGEISTPAHLSRSDVAVAVAVTALAAMVGAYCASAMGSAYFDHFNVWFDADTPRVLRDLTSRGGDHHRTAVHPISSLTLTPLSWGLHGFLGISQPMAAKVIVVSFAAGTAGLYLLTLRMMGVGSIVAFGLSLAFILSASFVHWSGVVELFAPGGFTIMLALAALAAGTRIGPLGWVIVSAASLSITITNWMAGLAACIVRWPRIMFAGVTLAALALVVGLSIAQKDMFSGAQLFFKPRGLVAEMRWTQPAMVGRDEPMVSWSPMDNLRSLTLSTLVAPPPYFVGGPKWDSVSNQRMQWSDASPRYLAATLLWGMLLSLGVWGAARSGTHRPLAVAVGLALLGQVALHSIYGHPTFLYSAHFLPLLMTIAAFGWYTPCRRIMPALVVIFCILAAGNNLSSFQQATALMNAAIDAQISRKVGEDFR